MRQNGGAPAKVQAKLLTMLRHVRWWRSSLHCLA